jgi:RNA polymerase sigma factor (sigma-70 family)
MTDDTQLIERFATRGDEDAFRTLIDRHLDLVYSAALRLANGDAPLAEDVAQSVFTDLARKARELPRDVVLAGWLYEAVRFAAAKAIRGERRRQAREQEALTMQDTASDTAPDWEQLRPVLDAAMGELSVSDRNAILLRYFQNQDFHAVGLALGVTDDAAQKRVSRAVDRLREFLAQRGITLGAHSLVVVITANAIQAAPVGLSAATAVAALTGTTLITAATATVGKGIAMTTAQKVLITAILAAAVGTGIYEAREASILRAQVQTLPQQAPLAGALEQLTQERDQAANQLAVLRDQNEQLNRNSAELLRLRGEVTLLRREREEWQAKLAAAAKTNLTAAQRQDVDTNWVRAILDAQPKERGAAAGAMRGKFIRREGTVTSSEVALGDALHKRQEGYMMENSPAAFADFQTAFIQAVVGFSDPARARQIHDIIEKTYEQAMASGLVLPSKPQTDTEAWVQRRYQLDRQATAQVQQLFTDEERKWFDRAFLGVMGVDLGLGVDKSNYPKGVLSPE